MEDKNYYYDKKIAGTYVRMFSVQEVAVALNRDAESDMGLSKKRTLTFEIEVEDIDRYNERKQKGNVKGVMLENFILALYFDGIESGGLVSTRETTDYKQLLAPTETTVGVCEHYNTYKIGPFKAASMLDRLYSGEAATLVSTLY